jgi:hypothetical protein
MSLTATLRLSRRQLLGGCAGALAVAGAGTLAIPATAAVASTPVSDGTLLSYALEIELLSVFAYEHMLGLAGDHRPLLAEFLGHERQHVAALESELRPLGQSPPRAVDTLARAKAVLAQHGLSSDIGSVRKFEDAIKLLLDIEGLSQGAYYAMSGLLNSQSPLLPAVQALACEAQHQALLTALLYPGKIERVVPGPFVEGWQ